MTKSELRDRVLQKLGKVGLEQTAGHNLKTDIEQGIDEIYGELQAEGLAVWPSTGSVPTKLVRHVVNLVCLNRADGISIDRYNRFLSEAGRNGSLAKREIRKIIATRYDNAEQPTDF